MSAETELLAITNLKELAILYGHAEDSKWYKSRLLNIQKEWDKKSKAAAKGQVLAPGAAAPPPARRQRYEWKVIKEAKHTNWGKAQDAMGAVYGVPQDALKPDRPGGGDCSPPWAETNVLHKYKRFCIMEGNVKTNTYRLVAKTTSLYVFEEGTPVVKKETESDEDEDGVDEELKAQVSADEDAAIEAAAQAAKKAPAKPPTAERPKGRKRDAEEAAEAPEEAPRSAKKGRGGKKGGK